MTNTRRAAILERWMLVLYANVLRYAVENARVWMDRCPFQTRQLVERCVAEQDALMERMTEALHTYEGVPPPLGYPEDVSYLNYVHLPVALFRAAARMEATIPPIEVELRELEEAGEFDLIDIGEDFIALLRRQVEALKPLCASPEQVSPR